MFAILGSVRVGYQVPDYTAYEDMLDYHRYRIEPVALLLRGAGKGLSRSIEDMGLVEVASDDMGLALAAVEIGAHRALQVLS